MSITDTLYSFWNQYWWAIILAIIIIIIAEEMKSGLIRKRLTSLFGWPPEP
jgi:hypothetical protein